MNNPRNLRATVLLQSSVGKALLALGVGLALLYSSLAVAAPLPQDSPHATFLPLAQNGQTGTTPPPPVRKGAFFLNKQIKNNSADVAVDALGGMHAAYAHFVPLAEHPKAVYTFCGAGESACANPSAWQSVALGDNVEEVQLALTAAGKPRMLIVSVADNLGRDHSFAACDQRYSRPG
jgi:hypothetical protein